MNLLECALLALIILMVVVWVYEHWPGKGDF